ncbi:MAG: F0F1 ATP synthase subunit A [Erysipelotrichaceae bacterium]
MEIQTTVYSIIIVTLFISLLMVFINYKLRKYDPLTEPKGIVLLVMMGIQIIENMTIDSTNEKVARQISPYMAIVIVYIFLSNISGLFAIEPPTSNLSVTLTLAAITCVLIEVFAIKENGVKRYLLGYFEPFAPMVVINLISKVSTLLSLSLRLFGNVIAGTVLMSVIYQLLALVSSAIPLVGNINIVAIFVAPVLHCYFDIFSGAIQAYVFTMLTISFIGKELPSEEN